MEVGCTVMFHRATKKKCYSYQTKISMDFNAENKRNHAVDVVNGRDNWIFACAVYME